MIQYASPCIRKKDIKEVNKCLNTTSLSKGSYTALFKDSLLDYTKAKYCVLFNSGTSALWASFKALKEYTITNPIETSLLGFNSTINTLDDFFNYNHIDVEYDTGCTEKTMNNSVVTHYAGNLCNWIKHSDNVVLEDACHAFGGTYEDDSKVGNSKYSLITCVSFHAIKNITCGEGGAAFTNKLFLYHDLLRIQNIGRTNKYSLPSHGYNLRMSDINAALGYSQLRDIDIFKSIRYELCLEYSNLLKNLIQVQTPTVKKNCFYHLYVIKVKRRNELKAYLNKYFKTSINNYPASSIIYNKVKLPKTSLFQDECLSLPLHCNLKKKDIRFICSKIKSFYR